MKILIASAAEEDRRLAEVLERLSHQMAITNSSKDLLDGIMLGCPELVVVAKQLPDGDGVKAIMDAHASAKRIPGDFTLPPFIVLLPKSEEGLDPSIEIVEEPGKAPFWVLCRPFHVEFLIDMIECILTGRKYAA
jgi:hypothetical protein